MKDQKLNELSVKDIIRKGKQIFNTTTTGGINSRIMDRLYSIAREFNGQLTGAVQDDNIVKFVVSRRNGADTKYKFNVDTGKVSLGETIKLKSIKNMKNENKWVSFDDTTSKLIKTFENRKEARRWLREQKENSAIMAKNQWDSLYGKPFFNGKNVYLNEELKKEDQNLEESSKNKFKKYIGKTASIRTRFGNEKHEILDITNDYLLGKRVSPGNKGQKIRFPFKDHNTSGPSSWDLVDIVDEINESVKPSKTVDAIFKVAKSGQAKKVDGVLVDISTANLVSKVWDQLDDRMKKKINNLDAGKLGTLVWKLTETSKRMNEVDSSRLELDQSAVKKVYKKASGKNKKIFNQAIKSYKDKKFEKDYRLQDKVADALYDYTYEIFPTAPDDEVIIDGDSIIDIVDTMSSLTETSTKLTDILGVNEATEIPDETRFKTDKGRIAHIDDKFGDVYYITYFDSKGNEISDNVMKLNIINKLIKQGKWEKIEESINEANGRLNKKVLKYVKDYAGSSYREGSPEFQWVVKEMLKGALREANFHSYIKKVDKYFGRAKDPFPTQPDMKDVVQDKGIQIAKWAKWDGFDIVNAFVFTVSMTIGRPVGEKLEGLLSESVNEAKNIRTVLQNDVAKTLKVPSSSIDVGVGDFAPVKTKDGNSLVVVGLDKKVKDISFVQADFFGKETIYGGYLLVKVDPTTGKLIKIIGRFDSTKDISPKKYVNEKYNVNLKTGKYDIGASKHSTGTMFYDRNKEEHGDYKKIALVMNNGDIKWYDKKVPPKIKKHIEKYSSNNESVNEGLALIRKIVKRAKKMGIDNWDDLEDLIRDEFPTATGADFTLARQELNI